MSKQKLKVGHNGESKIAENCILQVTPSPTRGISALPNEFLFPIQGRRVLTFILDNGVFTDFETTDVSRQGSTYRNSKPSSLAMKSFNATNS